MAVPSMGILARLGIGDTSTVDKPLEFASENVRKIPTVKDTGGIRGTLSALDARAREGTYTVEGDVTIGGPSPAELDYVLPYLTGSVKSGNDFALANTAKPSFFLAVDLGAKVPVFGGCKFSKGVFRSSQGNFLELILSVMGKTETPGAAGSFPSLALDVGEPYIFHDGTLTVGGVSKEFMDFEMTLDNAIFGDKHRNSQSRTQLPEGERVVSWRITTPFSADETSLYTTASVAVAAVFTNGSKSLTLTSPAVRFAAETPSMPGFDEITLGLQGRARRTAGALELTISNDVT